MNPDLTQLDVVRVRIRPEDKDFHPAVVISRAEVCADARKQSINVIYGTTRRPAGGATPTDVMLKEPTAWIARLCSIAITFSPSARKAWIRVMAA